MSEYQTIAPAFEGQQGNMVPATFISRSAEESIDAGKPVKIGTEARTCVNATDGDGFLGIYCPTSLIREGVKNEDIRIITQGVVYVAVADDVSEGDEVGFNASGEFSTAAATTYETRIIGAQFDAAATTGELAPVRMMGTETETVA